ncbi:MAG TPA: hypothetical protein VJM32_02265 [Candidatus Saccharimonadales bacterium]|nr:hypothetical protein [Candidatus Saccharimonadales bacterium]
MSERISNHVKNLGLESRAIVVGDGLLDEFVRPVHSLDVAVDSDTYRQHRELHDWHEVQTQDGRNVLTRGDQTMSIGWGDATAEELGERGFIEQGVRYAGLPDVYSWKQQAGHEQDLDDLALLRERLYDRPLPLAMIHRERAYIDEIKPLDLPDHAALAVAANGLYVVRTIFGDKNHRVHTYSGSVETGDVLAGYHEYWHSAGGAERVARHITKVNQGRLAVGQSVLFTPADSYAAIAGFAYHDSRMGDGRQSTNPDGFDELRAAQMAARHLELAGCTDDDMPRKSYNGIRATGFNEATKSQDIDPSRGDEHIQVALAGTDLGTFAEPGFALETIHLTIEDLTRIGAGFDRPLGKKIKALGTPVTTIPQALAIIDTDPALVQDFAKRLAGSAGFCKSYTYNPQWTLDRPGLRTQNADFIKNLADALAQGRMNATEAYAQATAFVERMQTL